MPMAHTSIGATSSSDSSGGDDRGLIGQRELAIPGDGREALVVDHEARDFGLLGLRVAVERERLHGAALPLAEEDEAVRSCCGAALLARPAAAQAEVATWRRRRRREREVAQAYAV
eukprot:CAMPEP_0195071534 /NCGR_PEP_ID=MMETSP0448-20130528/15331_2 /TAXON_ID=66468 /ORGANISM="Heterocapsa triquestra, Strain CCMP 448" /LENGTH=115 /DNA_ID=CAMNT_0040103403 /DNA_START=111 /DNA_END=454 /DNA_ORIENTATION=-